MLAVLEASLMGENLTDANFREKNLDGANFRGANLHSVEIKASMANLSQKEAFREVMTDEQFNAMVWL